jgi:hypothetical protein
MAATMLPLLVLAAVVVVLVAMLRARRGRSGSPAEPESEGEKRVRAYGLVLRDELDSAQFGPVLAGRVWDRLMTCKVGEGLIHEFHRDFCGHGLIRTREGVKLCDIQDGHDPGDAIAEWRSREDFVAFFAEQSDYSCSGWDERAPVFFSSDEWYRNNQRLTREKLLRFLGATSSG